MYSCFVRQIFLQIDQLKFDLKKNRPAEHEYTPFPSINVLVSALISYILKCNLSLAGFKSRDTFAGQLQTETKFSDQVYYSFSIYVMLGQKYMHLSKCALFHKA